MLSPWMILDKSSEINRTKLPRKTEVQSDDRQSEVENGSGSLVC